MRATGAAFIQSYWLALLAEVLGKDGQANAGLTLLAEALATANQRGERFYEAELYRLRGELSLQQESQKSKVNPNTQHLAPNTEVNVELEAEECFRKAIGIARQQQAKSWELRASMSLARLWQQQGRQKEAHDLLAKIYNWFSEGFDTKDLREAKVLLEELSH